MLSTTFEKRGPVTIAQVKAVRLYPSLRQEVGLPGAMQGRITSAWSYHRARSTVCPTRTEYWKSQPKKFCDFCKCWITDNKPSVEFHEGGKKHKENVQRKITEVRKKGMQTVKNENELKRNLEAIEVAAMEAYKKDLGLDELDEDKSTCKSKSTLSATSDVTSSSAETTADQPSSGCTIIYHGTQPVAECCHFWTIGQSPEGHYYYYNSQTQASQWEIPDCLQPDNSTAPEESSNNDDHQSETQEEKDKGGGEDEKRDISSPYGAWITVRATEPPAVVSKPQEATVQQKLESSEETATEDPETTAKKTEKKFKERATPKIAFRGNEVVTFKKRKLNSEKKRNIRQTKFDS